MNLAEDRAATGRTLSAAETAYFSQNPLHFEKLVYTDSVKVCSVNFYGVFCSFLRLTEQGLLLVSLKGLSLFQKGS